MYKNDGEKIHIIHKMINEASTSTSQLTEVFQKEVQKKGLSGVKDVDFKILSELNDCDLFSFSVTNKYINQMCKDEYFWRNRFIFRFGRVEEPRITWRRQYLTVISHLNKWSKNPWEYFNRISWSISDSPYTAIDLNKDKYSFLFLELGKEITLYFPIDRRYRLKFVKRVYTKEKDFVPLEILNIVYKFYQEPISVEEYIQASVDIRNVGDNTVDDVLTQKVKRIDIMGGATLFNKFDRYKERYVLFLSS